MNTDRKVILYIAISLDGYIAGKNESLDFLSVVEKEGEDYGYGAFISTIDTIILGRKTYDKVLSMGFAYPAGDQHVYVVTRTERTSTEKITFFTGNLRGLVTELKSMPGKNIFCDGGAEIVTAFLKNDLIDEIIISVIPVLLGDGVRLFKDGRPEQKLVLKSARHFDTGLVQLHYGRDHVALS